MAGFDLIVRNGVIATASELIKPPNSDIGIIDGTIACIGNLSSAQAARVIDAKGAYITPGGIDSHTHVDQGSGIATTDSFESASRSAIAGGTTTFICFADQGRKDESLYPMLEKYHAKATGNAYCDYAFHIILTNPSPTILKKELPDLCAKGITSVKIYMTYDGRQLTDRQILDIMLTTRAMGMVTMVHAENWDMIKLIIEQLEESGLTDPYYHAVSRPNIAEDEATYRAISLAELMDTPILLVHVSSRVAAQHIRNAQTRNLPICGETCPQYLYLMSEELRGCHYEGAKAVCSPPLRDTPEDLEAMWTGIANGTFTTFSSDHCPSIFDHPEGKKLGLDANGVAHFKKIPNGLPGIETRIPLLFQGIVKKRISIQKFVEVSSTNPAKLYGLDKKGSIAPGYDADVVIWYPDGEQNITITNSMLHHSIDYTPYEGMPLGNYPRYTIIRGQVVWDRDGEGVTGKKGYGNYVPRVRNQFKVPRGKFVNDWVPNHGIDMVKANGVNGKAH